MNYEKKSNLEINKRVARYMGGFVGRTGDWLKDGVKVTDSRGGLFYTERSYCHKVEDAWPIIVENGITILFDDCGSCEVSYDYKCKDTLEILTEFVSIKANEKDKILRAAMICFLKKKDREM